MKNVVRKGGVRAIEQGIDGIDGESDKKNVKAHNTGKWVSN